MAASEMIQVRAPGVRKRLWQAAAANEGLTLSAYVTRAVQSAVNGKPFLTADDLDALDEVRTELRRQGQNLNAMVRSLQRLEMGYASDSPDPDRMSALRDGLDQVYRQLLELMQRKL
jgi:hypothetical protein